MLTTEARQADEVPSIHGHEHGALTPCKIEDFIVRRSAPEQGDLYGSLGGVTPVLSDLRQRFAATLIKQQKHEPSAVAGPSAGRA
jgi:hypothetical protein